MAFNSPLTTQRRLIPVSRPSPWAIHVLIYSKVHRRRVVSRLRIGPMLTCHTKQRLRYSKQFAAWAETIALCSNKLIVRNALHTWQFRQPCDHDLDIYASFRLNPDSFPCGPAVVSLERNRPRITSKLAESLGKCTTRYKAF